MNPGWCVISIPTKCIREFIEISGTGKDIQTNIKLAGIFNLAQVFIIFGCMAVTSVIEQ